MSNDRPTVASSVSTPEPGQDWSFPGDEVNLEAIELLRSWQDGDEEEQRETLECLIRNLDADRFSTRKLFP